MYAVVRRYNIVEGMTPRVIERVEAEYVEKVRTLPGFVSYLVVDPNDGTLLSLALFSERASAQESNRVASEFVRMRLHGMVSTAPMIVSGEVVVRA